MLDWFSRRKKDNPVTPAVPRNARDALDRFRRDCFIPRVEPGEGSPASSRFGGRLALLPGESWPTCGSCKEKMSLFVQIDLTTAPHPESTPDPLRRGLLQLLYCVNDNCRSSDYGPFRSSALARLVSSQSLGALRIAEEGPVFPAQSITAWTPTPDFPNCEEAMSLGITIAAAELDDCYALESDRGNAIPIQSDKLYGWPDWVQSLFYPSCPTCKKPMTYVFQMSSNDHIPYMFDDSGIGHVCVCPDHPAVASFYWDCC